MIFAPVAPDFFAQPVLRLARGLVGKVLVHVTSEGTVAGRIVETEAYRGPEDLAAHSRRGLRTPRNEVMYGPAGHAYVFLLYGSSWAFNIVAGEVDEPHAVLVRAIEPVTGLEIMATRRRKPATDRDLTNGPGKLSQALGLSRAQNGVALLGGALYVAEGGASALGRSHRINIDYAGPWVDKPWRFYERDNRHVSVKPR